jgi:hypothetical protein
MGIVMAKNVEFLIFFAVCIEFVSKKNGKSKVKLIDQGIRTLDISERSQRNTPFILKLGFNVYKYGNKFRLL